MNIKTTIKYYVNPDLLEKSSILDSINYIANKYRKRLTNKKLLDIGCGSKPYKQSFKQLGITYEGIDFENFSVNYSFKRTAPDYYFSKNYLNDFKLSQFNDDSYDIVTAFQVLEHHENIDMFFSETCRILKQGGYLLISFPFIWELHEEPNDFQRLTHYKIKKLCITHGLRMKEVVKRGSTLSVISQLLNLSLKNMHLKPFIKNCIYFGLFCPLQTFSSFYDKQSQNLRRKIFLGYTILIIK